MGFASAISNCVRSPRRYRPLPTSDITSTLHLPKRFRVQSIGSYTSSLYAANRSRRRGCTPIACSTRTEQEDDLSTSGDATTSSEPYDEVNSVDDHSSSPLINPAGKNQEIETYKSSFTTVALCVSTAVAFGVGLGLKDGIGKASEFFAGYLLEQSLSVDNLFVFVLVFKYFKVPTMYQNRVLSYGIAGAVIFRLTLIILGSATLQRFEAVNLLLAAILLFSSFKLFSSEEDESDLSDNFIVKTCQKFIPVTSSYDGNRFFTNQNDTWKASHVLDRQLRYFLRWR